MKKTIMFIVIFIFYAVLSSCAHKQPIYVEANKTPETIKPPVVVAVSKPMPLPGQLRKVPEAFVPETKAKALKPWEVIEKANKEASQNPSNSGYFNGIMQYDFAPGAIYQVYCAPLKLTDIQLQPGETIIGKPAAGDTVRWIMGIGISKIDGLIELQHLYVKPTRTGLSTTLCINTNRRTYHIELNSFEKTYMLAVNWRYPHDEIAMIRETARIGEQKESVVTASMVSLENLNFGYRIETINGKTKPKWVPLKVFDDGRKTFIQFPKEMISYEAPVLFVLSDADEATQLVNYRVKNEFYIVDRLFDKAELRVGQKDQIVFRITRVHS